MAAVRPVSNDDLILSLRIAALQLDWDSRPVPGWEVNGPEEVQDMVEHIRDMWECFVEEIIEKNPRVAENNSIEGKIIRDILKKIF